MLRRKLAVQLAAAFLLAALLPLAGVTFLTLHLLQRSLSEQARQAREQIGRAAAALVRDYLNDATTKLKNIARQIDPRKDPRAETEKLNAQVNPEGLFLEIAYVKLAGTPEIVAQAQQRAFGEAQSLNRSRAFNEKVQQNAQILDDDDPLLVEALRGNEYVNARVDIAGAYNGLRISVPAAGKDVLVGTLDLRPLQQTVSLLGGYDRHLLLVGQGFVNDVRAPGRPPIAHEVSVGHADWRILVEEWPSPAIWQSRVHSILGVSLAALLAVGLAAFLGSRLTRPVRALAGTADALGRGDFSARSGIRRDDEIGQLAAAFDRMAAAVQELDRLKDDFVSHVSHELRTPLTSAKMTLANVREGLSGVDTLDRVQGDLDRLIRMVNELLDVAKIEAGVTLEKRPTDLGALVRSTVDGLRPLAKVALEVRGQGSAAEVDAARVQQIVLNLVDNALKYARSKVDVEIDGRTVRVSDDGPGVPPEHRESIFRRFSKVETGPKPPGAGLGLSIARKLAELHGGTLVCLGNTFELKL